MASRKDVQNAAREVGLHVEYYSPGDGGTYKFFLVPTDYFAGDGIGRVHGTAADALVWLAGYRAAFFDIGTGQALRRAAQYLARGLVEGAYTETVAGDTGAKRMLEGIEAQLSRRGMNV